MHAKPFYKYIAALLLFGSNGLVASLIPLPSLHIVLLRTLIGSLFLLAVAMLSGIRFSFLQHRRQFLFLVASGAALGAGWIFLFEAYVRIGVSLASLLYYCGPVLVMALSPLLFRERLTAKALVGFGAVLLGVVLINGCSGASLDAWGIACGLLSALLYAIMVICSKKAPDITGLENSALQIASAFLTVALWGLLQEGPSLFGGILSELQAAGLAKSLPPALVLGLVNTGLGCYLYFSAIGRLRVQTVAVCGYLEPLSAVLFSILFLGETLRLPQVLGAVLILGGALWGELSARGAFSFSALRKGSLACHSAGKK